MAKQSKIDDDHHVLRWIRARYLYRRNGDKKILGCTHDAFKYTTQDKGSLSVQWLEHFAGSKKDQTDQSVTAFCANFKGKVEESAYSTLNVGDIKETCESHGAKIRIVREATKNNPAHSGIRQLPQNKEELFDDLCELAKRTIFPHKP